ncbi:MAG: hypothetical protein M5T61_21375 [Acidimicrobiia bacterium]|nr:hypothetical protein [Acidimicrobiia bacterium]
MGLAADLAGKALDWFKGSAPRSSTGSRSGITGAWDSFTSWLGGKLGS